MSESKIHNFEYDDFQREAIEAVKRGNHVMVSAPTGAGKTVIAEYLCHQAVNRGEGIIYTAPVKALSNQKYRDFSSVYGRENVGILTGDVVINPEAPILIMTTEIFRNRLFEPETLFSKRRWVVFDEIHYLDDLERGTVWEESLIFFPRELRILALSATIPNIYELSQWIESIHKIPVEVIIGETRPVPLSFYFMLHNKSYEGFSQKFKGAFGKNASQATNHIEALVEHLKEFGGFPAIYFSFSRKRCEILARESKRFDLVNSEERKALLAHYEEQLRLFHMTDDVHANEMRPFVQYGIAFHHAGMLPALKEIIERLFTSKLIKLIFTTETFALGINMPAKVVIFDDVRKFYGYAFDTLKTRDFYQMAGRAGRRGYDDFGYVYTMVNPRTINFNRIREMITNPPEPVFSQFNSTYGTVLNLYQMLGEKMLNIYPQSFHSYQSGKKQKKHGIALLRNKLSLLKFMGYIDEKGLTSRGIFGAKIFGYELQCAELFMEGFFEKSTTIEIAITLTAMIFEPRKGQVYPRLSKDVLALKNKTDKISWDIEKVEKMFFIEPGTKKFFFNLSECVRTWMSGATFEELHAVTDVDEGEIIRYLRMTLQILREMKHIPDCSEDFYNKIKDTMAMIKRDVVDPEAQFSMG